MVTYKCHFLLKENGIFYYIFLIFSCVAYAMFEQFIEAEKQTLTAQIQPLLREQGAYLYGRDIQTAKAIHEFYRAFFAGEIEWWIHEQKLMRGTNPRFDFSDSALAGDIARLDAVSRQAARFDRRDLYSTIDFAVKTRFNFLLRPRTTLKWFVFRGEITRSIEDVLLRLRYLHGYRYLIDGVERIMREYMMAPTAERMNSTSFERYVTQVDRGQILEYTPREFLAMFEPMYELFSPHGHESGSVPVQALIVFLDDKGIYRIANELERRMKSSALRSVSYDVLAHIVDDVITRTEANPAQSIPKTKPAPLPFEFENIITRKPGITDLQGRSDLLPVSRSAPLHADISSLQSEYDDAKNHDTTSSNGSQGPETIDASESKTEHSGERNNSDTYTQTPDEKAEDDAIHAEMQAEWQARQEDVQHTVQETSQPFAEIDAAYNVEDIPEDTDTIDIVSSPVMSAKTVGFSLPYLDTLISVRDKEKFITALCDEDIHQYNVLMDTLDAHPTWKSASSSLDKIFLERRIDPYSKIAQRFVELVYSRYVR